MGEDRSGSRVGGLGSKKDLDHAGSSNPCPGMQRGLVRQKDLEELLIRSGWRSVCTIKIRSGHLSGN